MFNGSSNISRTYLAVDLFLWEHFETSFHRSCFWDHCVILQAPRGHACVLFIFRSSLSRLEPTYVKYLVNPNQTCEVNPGRVAILGEPKRGEVGTGSFGKSFIKEEFHMIVKNQNQLHSFFKCQPVIKLHLLFPTASATIHSGMMVSLLVCELTNPSCRGGSLVTSPRLPFSSSLPTS